MTLVRDLSGNGSGVNLNNYGLGDPISVAGGDVTIANATRLRVGGAGNVVLRYPNSTADITVPGAANEYIPIAPGTIVRQTNTTATGLLAFNADAKGLG
jgi:hypothetical protein